MTPPPVIPIQPRWLTLEQTGAYFGFSTRWARQAVADGRIPVSREWGPPRVDLRTLEKMSDNASAMALHPNRSRDDTMVDLHRDLRAARLRRRRAA